MTPAVRNKASLAAEGGAIAGLPLVLALVSASGIDEAGFIGMAAALGALLLFFFCYEWRRPSLRETMPVVVLAALAAAGRVLFAPIPDIKPVSAVCILAGAVFGRRSGFMVGALAAFVSNFFFGQGAWTPWQMYAWGLIGWLAGVLAARGVFNRQWAVYVAGFLAGPLYGFILNFWSIIGFFHPQTFAQLITIWAAALPLDAVHGIATVAFLALLWAPWHKKLTRLKTLYDLSA